MNHKPIHSKEQFAHFVLRQMRRLNPDLQITAVDPHDPFQYFISYSDDATSAKLHLHNVWEDYIRSGNLDMVVNFVHHQCQTMAYIRSTSRPDGMRIDPGRIYPVLRHPDYRQSQSNADDYLSETVVPELDTLFVQDQAECYIFLTKALLRAGRIPCEAEVKEQALNNIRMRGWHAPAMRLPAANMKSSGDAYHIFTKTEYPFELQFFLPDMVLGEMPSTFLLAIPARDMAVALTTDKPIRTLESARKIAIRSGFAALVRSCYEGEPRPISRHMYWMRDGRARACLR